MRHELAVHYFEMGYTRARSRCFTPPDQDAAAAGGYRVFRWLEEGGGSRLDRGPLGGWSWWHSGVGVRVEVVCGCVRSQR